MAGNRFFLCLVFAVIAAASAKSLRPAAKRSEGLQARAPVNVCYVCGLNCQNKIKQSWPSVEYFFDELTQNTENVLKTASPDFTLNNHLMVLPSDALLLDYYRNDTYDLAVVNDIFWNGPTSLYSSAMGSGCNIGVFVAKDDYFFDRTSVAGIAGLFTICGEKSYVTIQLQTSVNLEAAVLAHEAGHASGVYHNGEVADALAGIGSFYPDLFKNLTDSCPDSSCASSCVMNPSVNGGSDDFGDCGRAYLAVTMRLSEDYPQFYSANQCLPPQSEEKRSLQSKRGDEEGANMGGDSASHDGDEPLDDALDPTKVLAGNPPAGSNAGGNGNDNGNGNGSPPDIAF